MRGFRSFRPHGACWFGRSATKRPENLHKPVIYPPPDVMKRLEFLQQLGKGTKLYDEVWTQAKAKWRSAGFQPAATCDGD